MVRVYSGQVLSDAQRRKQPESKIEKINVKVRSVICLHLFASAL